MNIWVAAIIGAVVSVLAACVGFWIWAVKNEEWR